MADHKERATTVIDGVHYLKCEACDNPMQIRETGLCAPCTFGEADSISEFDPIPVEEGRKHDEG